MLATTIDRDCLHRNAVRGACDSWGMWYQEWRVAYSSHLSSTLTSLYSYKVGLFFKSVRRAMALLLPFNMLSAKPAEVQGTRADQPCISSKKSVYLSKPMVDSFAIPRLYSQRDCKGVLILRDRLPLILKFARKSSSKAQWRTGV